MIGMQHIDERNTAVPDWFVGYYDSGYFWVGVAVLSLLTVVLIVLETALPSFASIFQVIVPTPVPPDTPSWMVSP